MILIYSLSVHLSMDIWAVFSSVLSQITWLRRFGCKPMGGHGFPFLLGKHLEMEGQDHLVGACLIFEETFLKWLYHFMFSPTEKESSNFSTFS